MADVRALLFDLDGTLVDTAAANAAAYARTGVDFLAVGALTHSAPILDIGLDLRAAE